MKIQPKNIVITVCVIVITPFVWSLLFSNNGMQTFTDMGFCRYYIGPIGLFVPWTIHTLDSLMLFSVRADGK